MRRATLVEGNFVGLTASGTSTLSDNGNGVSVIQSTDNTIGGTAAGAGNVISGQAFDGVTIDEASGNVVQGNKIGTDPTGTIALGNCAGVLLGYASAANNLIGGTAPGAGNLISGNYGDGVYVATTLGTGNAIEGNLIGTDVTGENNLRNGGDGVFIEASGVSLGGTASGAGNVISGNGEYGVEIESDDITGLIFTPTTTLVEGNLIGTDVTGTLPLGNGFGGVAVFGGNFGAAGNTIGGTAAGAGNIIAFNGGNGVTVGDYTDRHLAVDDSILSNSIYANTGLGIDLGDDGVTPNNSGRRTAPTSQNYPDLTVAAAFPSSFVVVGNAERCPEHDLHGAVLRQSGGRSLGYGQGQYLLGTASVTTELERQRQRSSSRCPSVPAGVQSVSATATDPSGNTSEFSAGRAGGRGNDPPIAAGNDTYYTDINTTLNVSGPGRPGQ